MKPDLFPVTVTNHAERIEVAQYAKENGVEVLYTFLDNKHWPDDLYPLVLNLSSNNTLHSQWKIQIEKAITFSEFKSRIQPVLFQVECVDDEKGEYINVTKGKKYDVCEESADQYVIIANNGEKSNYFKSRFKRLNESKPDFTKIAVGPCTREEMEEVEKVMGLPRAARFLDSVPACPFVVTHYGRIDNWTESTVEHPLTFPSFMSKYGGRKEEAVTGYKLLKQYPNREGKIYCNVGQIISNVEDFEWYAQWPEFWEPQYKPKSKTISLGSPAREFRGSKGKLETKNCNGSWDDVTDDFNKVHAAINNFNQHKLAIESYYLHGELYTHKDHQSLYELIK